MHVVTYAAPTSTGPVPDEQVSVSCAKVWNMKDWDVTVWAVPLVSVTAIWKEVGPTAPAVPATVMLVPVVLKLNPEGSVPEAKVQW